MGFDYTVMTAVQSLRELCAPLFDTFFCALTFLAEETFLLVFFFALYWAVNKRIGELLIVSLYASMGTNGIIKDIVRRPRPYLSQDAGLYRYIEVDNFFVDTKTLSTSFSFPSGHSQTAGAYLTPLALRAKKMWVKIVCFVLILGVMVSRIYLGVHYPTDTIAGAVLGIGFAVLIYFLMTRYENRKILIMAVLVAVACLGLLTNFSSGTAKTVGIGIGALIGFILEQRYIKFTVDGSILERILRVALGFALIMGLRLGLKALFPADSMFFDGLRYAIVGFTAFAGWPYIFSKVGRKINEHSA